jgi:F-type H+-transporting ATPase subunit b
MAEAHPPTNDAAHPAAAEAEHAAPGHDALNATTADHGGGHAEPTAFGFDASGWVALAMVAVFAVLLWKRVPSAIGKALDKKIGQIRQQLDEAAQLRVEAEALRAEYEAKAAQADAEAATMIERARTEAESIVRQAETDAAALIERRTRMAEDKIAAAERAAIDEVRARTAAAAAAAAATLIRDGLDSATEKKLVDATIAGLGR